MKSLREELDSGIRLQVEDCSKQNLGWQGQSAETTSRGPFPAVAIFF